MEILWVLTCSPENAILYNYFIFTDKHPLISIDFMDKAWWDHMYPYVWWENHRSQWVSMEGVEDGAETNISMLQSNHLPIYHLQRGAVVSWFWNPSKYRYRQQGTTVWSLIRIWLLGVQQSAFGLGATVILTGKVQASFEQQNGAC